jgi:hypothetical protein
MENRLRQGEAGGDGNYFEAEPLQPLKISRRPTKPVAQSAWCS